MTSKYGMVGTRERSTDVYGRSVGKRQNCQSFYFDVSQSRLKETNHVTADMLHIAYCWHLDDYQMSLLPEMTCWFPGARGKHDTLPCAAYCYGRKASYAPGQQAGAARAVALMPRFFASTFDPESMRGMADGKGNIWFRLFMSGDIPVDVLADDIPAGQWSDLIAGFHARNFHAAKQLGYTWWLWLPTKKWIQHADMLAGIIDRLSRDELRTFSLMCSTFTSAKACADRRMAPLVEVAARKQYVGLCSYVDVTSHFCTNRSTYTGGLKCPKTYLDYHYIKKTGCRPDPNNGRCTNCRNCWTREKDNLVAFKLHLDTHVKWNAMKVGPATKGCIPQTQPLCGFEDCGPMSASPQRGCILDIG